MTFALEVQHVSVRYGAALALNDLSLNLATGEILGLLGPNGAGKSTLLRVILGFIPLIPHSAATIRIFGIPINDPAALLVRQRIGFVPDPDGLDPRLRADQLLGELAALSAVSPLDQATASEALELRPADLRRRIGTLSRGTRQKVALVAGLQHRPDLLILDEPSEGLDPFAKIGLLGLLNAARARGATVLFSSHVLSEVEAICDRVAMIRRGRLLAVESLADLRRRLARRVVLRLAAGSTFVTLPHTTNIQQIGDEWQFDWSGAISDLLPTLAALPVVDLSITPPSLAAVFATLYGDEGLGIRD